MVCKVLVFITRRRVLGNLLWFSVAFECRHRFLAFYFVNWPWQPLSVSDFILLNNLNVLLPPVIIFKFAIIIILLHDSSRGISFWKEWKLPSGEYFSNCLVVNNLILFVYNENMWSMSLKTTDLYRLWSSKSIKSCAFYFFLLVSIFTSYFFLFLDLMITVQLAPFKDNKVCCHFNATTPVRYLNYVTVVCLRPSPSSPPLRPPRTYVPTSSAASVRLAWVAGPSSASADPSGWVTPSASLRAPSFVDDGLCDFCWDTATFHGMSNLQSCLSLLHQLTQA